MCKCFAVDVANDKEKENKQIPVLAENALHQDKTYSFFFCLILAFCFCWIWPEKKGIILSPNLDNSSKIQQGSLIVVIVVNMTASYI